MGETQKGLRWDRTTQVKFQLALIYYEIVL